MNLMDYLPGVPDFPKSGILFRDISPLVADREAFRHAIMLLDGLARAHHYTHLAAIESRGFIFGSALSLHANKGLVLLRKPNKLPLASHRESYGLEYGSDALEIQQSSLPKGAKVLIIDDVLATGGTIVAAAKLVRRAGFNVCGAITILEIAGLHGGEALEQHQIPFRTILRS